METGVRGGKMGLFSAVNSYLWFILLLLLLDTHSNSIERAQVTIYGHEYVFWHLGIISSFKTITVANYGASISQRHSFTAISASRVKLLGVRRTEVGENGKGVKSD